jgi:hypothetical protein
MISGEMAFKMVTEEHKNKSRRNLLEKQGWVSEKTKKRMGV